MQERSTKTRELILKAALRVFVREGFERAQIDTIAKESGRTKGAVYGHFRSKEDLFLSLLERRTSEADKLVNMMTEKATCQEEFIAGLRKIVLELRDPQWSILNLELKLYALRNPRARRRLKTVYRRIHSMEKGGFSGQNDSLMEARQSLLWTIVSGIVLDMSFDSQLMPEDRARQLLGDAFDGLFASKPLIEKHRAIRS